MGCRCARGAIAIPYPSHGHGNHKQNASNPMTPASTESKAKNEETGTHCNESNEQTSSPDHVKNERWMVRWTGTVAFLAGGLVFVGIVTAIIFWKQLKVMQGQLDEMQAQSAITRHQLRANLGLTIANYAINNSGGKTLAWLFTPVWKNSGGTEGCPGFRLGRYSVFRLRRT